MGSILKRLAPFASQRRDKFISPSVVLRNRTRVGLIPAKPRTQSVHTCGHTHTARDGKSLALTC